MESIVYRDGAYILGESDGLAWLQANGKPLKLTCQPYEPCMYITLADGKVTTLRNSFDPSVVLELFAAGDTVSSVTGRVYRPWDFCGLILHAVTEWGPQEVQIDDAERHYIKMLKGTPLLFPPIGYSAIRLEKAKQLMDGIVIGELSLDLIRYIYVIGIKEYAQAGFSIFGQLSDENYHALCHYNEITDWDPLDGDISPKREPITMEICQEYVIKHPLCGAQAGAKDCFGPEDLAKELIYIRA